jgi:hypothetical protein
MHSHIPVLGLRKSGFMYSQCMKSALLNIRATPSFPFTLDPMRVRHSPSPPLNPVDGSLKVSRGIPGGALRIGFPGYLVHFVRNGSVRFSGYAIACSCSHSFVQPVQSSYTHTHIHTHTEQHLISQKTCSRT